MLILSLTHFVALLAGVIIGGLIFHGDPTLQVKLAQARMKAAYQEAARLSRRIHRQRDAIRALKALVPAKPAN